MTEALILADDLNGHVRKERVEFERWHGGKSRDGRNEEGNKIFDFARSKDLTTLNTFFTKNDLQTYTFRSGPNQTNQFVANL